MVDTLWQVIHDEPVSPRQLNPKVPRDLEPIVLKCLEKTPARRYASVAELAGDLRRFSMASRSQRGRPARLNERGRWCRRQPVVAALMAAVALALMLGAGMSTFFAIEANARAREAIDERKRVERAHRRSADRETPR